MGANYSRNNILSNIYGVNFQNTFGGYAQVEAKPWTNLILTIGGRYDRDKVENLDAQSEISPKFGVSYSPFNNLSLRGSFGSGFRTPKSAERFASLKVGGFDLIPNVDLKSEKSTSYEIGGLFEFLLFDMPTSIDMAIFDNNFDDLIEPTFVTYNSKSVIQFINVTKARITGFELSLRTMLSHNLGMETALTLMEPKDITLNETLKYRSKVLWYNNLFYDYDNFGVNIQYRYISRPETIDERLGLQVIDHDARVDAHVVDISFKYDLKSLTGLKIVPSIYVKNLFDYYYTEMTGNLARTRFIGFEIKYDY